MSKDLLEADAGVKLAPEVLTVINTYLQTNDIDATSNMLGIPREKIITFLHKKEAKRYIDTVFLEQGYLNRNKIVDAMSTIIERKLEELEEAELGSNKDIADLLQMMHKMRHDEIKAMQADNKDATVVHQNNTQNNITASFGQNYNSLLDKLSGVKEVN